MIRRATIEDLPHILELGRQFHAYSPWKHIPINEDDLSAMLKNVIETGVILLSYNGMCGGIINPLYINNDHKAAIELFWWAPSEGLALRQAFEEWAAEQGASLIQFSALANERMGAIGRMYRRAGYDFVEGIFYKEVA